MFVHKTVSLVPHPTTPPRAVHGIDVRWFEKGDGRLVLRWLVNGADAVKVPPFAGKGRGDELWQTTCGELFLKDRAGPGYREFNFSPSGRWAAYGFSDYRAGMIDADDPAIEVSCGSGQFLFVLTALLDASALADCDMAAITAVIEERDGTKSYWALAHPPARPDFHDPACFAFAIPAREDA